jgi:hypothetical protein
MRGLYVAYLSGRVVVASTSEFAAAVFRCELQVLRGKTFVKISAVALQATLITVTRFMRF